ncbi:MAG: hypothetical protein A3I26_02210 [Candidatus Yanofskybacteria bacterium RIFCSPLOWO2_02_FULL_43_10]|nr:MAG: hypothetical protein A2742_02875 [Candidatus Yanofskybacteria bacterium RIFCSPHIGHO2_01_FULL_43_32]OGN11176.1 MAG: hypothetical protein A3C69_02490 [Candidatus Yanofskybacteria bacterium RIFCSPHIGHO2_02_FULL_43_12]OGN17548.1 MAG: hypothetical protein A3E34_03225 [Candidatus Yanofskybacteria bacterium RIFCSPHIGHO2_12_FULL_43_11]OGN25099.1 MAG: hypothetical protein A2923_01830 [Candidatus Yanofskybacteria bacterium RIFCSPLOWO2_01_FULL_43_46]OGN29875.1 MAG: hypothetical protein A3I26_02210
MKHRNAHQYHTGFDDNLTPLEPLDLSKINDFDDMLRSQSLTAFGGRTVGEAADTLFKMITDKNVFVVMTLSGAMTPAKMGLLVCEMVERGFVHAIVSTGALMTHGFVESSGRKHFKYNPAMSDSDLYEKGYNRIYDVIEPEINLDETEGIVHQILKKLPQNQILTSRTITRELGQWLTENTKERGILKSARLMNVPVYIPADTDSELGLDVYIYLLRQAIEGEKPFQFNPLLDLQHYTELINQQKKIALFTIGGGVPRNWAQQVAPLLELIQGRMPKNKAPKHIKGIRFSYGLRICPEPVNWGGLSGCTYSEGVSWGKMKLDGNFSEVLQDATVVWPWILKAVIQRLEKRGIKKIKKNFKLTEQLEKVAKLTGKYKMG